jgi:hypothetical protein
VDFTESSTIARAFSSVAMVRNVGEGAGNAEGPSECLGNHALSGGGPNGVDADVVQPLVGTSRSRVRTRLTFSSALAAPLIMNTGREFLPIGGFSGSNPSPTLARLIYLIKSHQVSSFFIPLRPGGDDPRLVWIRRHCLRTGTRPQTAGVEFGVYTCLPGLSKSSISAITSSPSTS